MWCRSAVNRTCLSRSAASRTRSSALSAPSRPSVRGAFCWLGFPLARPLPSISSAADRSALFGDFAGTTGLSDCPCPFIVGVCPWTSRRGPLVHRQRADRGSPGSRARCVRACTGSLTARDSIASCRYDASDMAFRLPPRRRRPEGAFFRGCIPGLPVPLSTLRGRPRMTRGRCGPLTLHRTTLASATPRRFNPAHGGLAMSTTEYETEGGIRIHRTVETIPIAGTIAPLVHALDSHRGALLASTYEYPGRYTRWDMGF